MILEPTSQQYVASLEHRIAGLQQQNDQLKQENMRLKRRIIWHHDIRHLKGANSTDKVVFAEVMDELDQHNVPKGQMHTPWLEDIAKRVQMSPSTIGRSIQFLADNGVLLRNEYPDPKTGKTRVDIGWTEQCEQPRTITLTEPRKKKSGKACLHCGHEALIIKERITRSQKVSTCTHCGNITIFQERDVQAPLEPNCTLADMDDDPDCNSARGLPDADIIHADECHPQDEDTPTCTIANYLESKNAILQAVPSEDESSSDELEYQKDALPNIPPAADAADLLLNIAGTGNEHIIMLKGTGSKYTTIDRALHRGDMIAHLKGVKTVGAKIQHPFGLTRAICDDADNPQDWQCLQEAALLLAQAGFKVILQPSPVQEGPHAGGGHLWVIFDKLVDASAARQTMLEIAPMLAESKEYWPNGSNRVRLPGGRYIHGGTDAWCCLYNAYGNELAHDGDGASAVLLAMQTPADVVRKYEKKTELVLMPQSVRSIPKAEQRGYLEDVTPMVIAEFNAMHAWDEIAAMAGGFNKQGYFPACWRGDRTPNVSVHPITNLAKDFSTSAWLTGSMDQYQVWCLIQGGQDWQEFKRKDLAQRCESYRLLKRVSA